MVSAVCSWICTHYSTPWRKGGSYCSVPLLSCSLSLTEGHLCLLFFCLGEHGDLSSDLVKGCSVWWKPEDITCVYKAIPGGRLYARPGVVAHEQEVVLCMFMWWISYHRKAWLRGSVFHRHLSHWEEWSRYGIGWCCTDVQRLANTGSLRKRVYNGKSGRIRRAYALKCKGFYFFPAFLYTFSCLHNDLFWPRLLLSVYVTSCLVRMPGTPFGPCVSSSRKGTDNWQPPKRYQMEIPCVSFTWLHL